MSNNKRLLFHQQLVDILGSSNVYFQPPENIKMEYPCLVYSRRTGDSRYANNRTYKFSQTYDVTYISKDPDDGFVDKFLFSMPASRYDRHYTSNNLHHDNFFVYNTH